MGGLSGYGSGCWELGCEGGGDGGFVGGGVGYVGFLVKVGLGMMVVMMYVSCVLELLIVVVVMV